MNALTAPNPRLLTTKEAAALLRVTSRTILNYVAAGDLQAVRIGGTVRIPSDAIERVMGVDALPF